MMNNDIKKITGNIHSVETCGTVDGPGIRYVVFTQGCALRCMYCHNPDTWSPNSESSRIKTTGEVLSDIVKYKSYFRFSGGGVTLSGGEPLLQKEFTAALFSLCKQEELHTALDTSGCVTLDDAAKEVLRYTDLVLLDIKSMNADTFNKITGSDVNVTLNFANYLSEQNIPVWIRFVLVPGLTDNEEELHALCRYVETLNNVERVQILPFHQMGAFKWQNMQLGYKLEETPVPTAQEVHKARELFESYGLNVK